MITSEAAARCAECGTQLAPSLLSCFVCGRLVHAGALKRAAADAELAQARGDRSAALSAWRSALPLLPRDSRQHAAVVARIDQLGAAPAAPAPDPGAAGAAATGGGKSAWMRKLGPLGVAGALLWKLKFLVLALASKAQLLLLGLTKVSTLFSMVLAMGAYWALYGWKFALGLVGSIYVHEMGHVAALRRFGIAATAPMFIPGVGAVVRLKEHPASPIEDARVGLAGPLWGLGAAVSCVLVYWATGAPIWGAIARMGAWINLFNLMPVWQLDGGRGFAALARPQRWIVVAVLGVAWALTGEGLLVLLLLLAVARAVGRDAPAAPDRLTLIQFVVLIGALSALLTLPVAGASP